MAYFQPATNTYAPVEELRPLFESAISHPEVIALAIGTRQDCVPDDVLDLLEELGGKVPLTVEYGLQTIHDKSLKWMNRGDTHESFPWTRWNVALAAASKFAATLCWACRAKVTKT